MRASRDPSSHDATDAARALLDAALEDRDAPSLAIAVASLASALEDATLRDARRLVAARATLDEVLATNVGVRTGTPTEAPRDAARASATLEQLALLTTPRGQAWASDLRAELARAWAPASSAAAWPLLLARLEELARALHDLDASARLASLSAERRRPLRLAIVGEFNAGKSTFINALVGAEIAPTGVLPTTATLHHLRYAPDPIARVLFALGHDPPERIVPVSDLRATLKSLDARAVRRVEILLPIPSLTRVEILDTPGFNAPDGGSAPTGAGRSMDGARHAEAARDAFEEADAAILAPRRGAADEGERARDPRRRSRRARPGAGAREQGRPARRGRSRARPRERA